MGEGPGWTLTIAFAQGTRAHWLQARQAHKQPELVKCLLQRCS